MLRLIAPRWYFLAVLILLPVASASGQATDSFPAIRDAEGLFERGVEAFETGDYDEALRLFERTHAAFPVHQKTTAAMAMHAKAAFRGGAYDEAERRAEALRQAYPQSRYVGSMDRLLDLIADHEAAVRTRTEPVRLGIALRLDGEQSVLAQALFNGIRLAVEEANGSIDLDQVRRTLDGGVDDLAFLVPLDEERRRVQMIFEDAGDGPADVEAAVERLAAENVDFIIGPLFSEDAVAAARVAERNGVVMIAPLATQDAVSEGRSYVFQANPSVTTRGRAMARFADESLGLEGLGILAQGRSDLSMRMAESFRAEAERRGLQVPFFHAVDAPSEFIDWVEETQTDSLYAEASADAPFDGVYMPFSGSGVGRDIRHALGSLQREGLEVRVLGNAEWHDTVAPSQGGRFNTVYSNDFLVDDARSEVRTFQARYEALSGEGPDRLAFVGYDVTQFVLQALNDARPTALHDRLRSSAAVEGLGMRIAFEGQSVNQALFFHRVRFGQVERLR
ncbi:MAG: ABC transporter substrate-binding protein [Bacteroidetes bacterium]|jgi:ABC-type branched-subunit amino acid transport system substrate-binding protein|nr:ABC transporter substrate-binding protein [Bacteroidota bacterium]